LERKDFFFGGSFGSGISSLSLERKDFFPIVGLSFSFGFFLGLLVFFFVVFLAGFFLLSFFRVSSMISSSSFLLTQFLSFSFSLPNMEGRSGSGLRRFWFKRRLGIINYLYYFFFFKVWL